MKNLFKFPSLSLYFSFIIICIGFFQISKLNISLYPETSRAVIRTGLSHPGQDSAAFKDEYGKRIEATLMAIDGVEKVEGFYNNSSSSWKTTFAWNFNSQKAKKDIDSNLAPIGSSFPKEWGGFHSYFNSNSSGLYLSLKSKKISNKQLINILEKEIKPQIESLEGVDSVFLSNPESEFVVITLNPKKMTQLGVFPKDIKESLRKVLYDKYLGFFKTSSNNYSLKVANKIKSLENLQNTLVKTTDNKEVLLKQVADAKIKKENSTFVFHDNGKSAIIFGINIKPSANINKTSSQSYSLIKKQIFAHDPETIVTKIIDPGKFIKNAISSMWIAILTAMLSAALVLWLFMRSLSSTLVIALTIPVSLAGGIILMNLCNIQINLLSLSAMALAVGMVVDGAIVVIDNIHRQSSLNDKRSLLDQIRSASKEVKNAVITSTLTTMIVFLPLVFTEPLTKSLLQDLAIVTIFVLGCSLIVTLVIIPPLFTIILTKKPKNQNPQWEQRYVSLLKKILQNKLLFKSITAATVILVGISIWILQNKIPKEIISTPTTDKIVINISYKKSLASPEESIKAVSSYEKQLEQKKYKGLISNHLSIIRLNGTQIICGLQDTSKGKVLEKLLEEELKENPGDTVQIFQWNPSSLKIPEPALSYFSLVKDSSSRENIRLFLEEYDELTKASGYIKENYSYPQHSTTPALTFSPSANLPGIANDKELLFNSVWDLITQASEVSYLDPVDFSDSSYQVKLKFPDNYTNSNEDLLNLNIRWQDKFLSLRQLLTTTKNNSWDSIYTKQGVEAYEVKSYLTKSKLHLKDFYQKKINTQITSLAKKHNTPVVFHDSEKDLNSNIKSLLLALLGSLLTLLMLLCYQFGPGPYPFLILLPIPLGLIGTSFSLYFFNSTLSLNSLMGLILLAGTAINNSIIFVDFFLKKRTANLLDSILECARSRVRPIVMTTITTLVGMLPLALGIGEGSEIIRPLGITVCGGLAISTLLTLFTVPMALFALGKKQNYSTILKVMLLGLFMGIASPKLEAKTLTLQQAQNQALSTNLVIKQNHITIKQADTHQEQQKFELIPRIDLNSSYSSYSHLGEKAQHSLRVTQDIPDPWSWSEKNKSLKESQKTTRCQQQATEFEVKQKAKQLYFKLLQQQELLALAQKNFDIAESLFKQEETKFLKGFSSQDNFTRAQINFLEQTNTLQLKRQQTKVAETELKNFISFAEKEPLTLSDKLSDDSALIKKLDSLGKPTLLTNSTLLLLKQEQNTLRAKTKETNNNYRPKLSLSFERDLDNKNYAAVNLNWNIFNHNRDCSHKKDLLLQQQKKSLEIKLAQQNSDLQTKKILLEASSSKAEFNNQKKLTTSYENLYLSSKKRYSQGVVSAKVFYEDLTKYITFQEKTLLLKYKILDLILRWQEESWH